MHTFDDYTERFRSDQLKRLRARAADDPLSGPVHVEIGSHRGRMLEKLALRYSERRFLGIELRRSWVEKANKRLDRAGVTNAEVICADAELALPTLFGASALIEALYVFYPDPWWKTRHQKRRFIRAENLEMLAALMRPGAPLYLRTDVGPLARAMRETLAAHPAFVSMPLADYPAPALPRSERDEVTIRNGLPVQALYHRRA